MEKAFHLLFDRHELGTAETGQEGSLSAARNPRSRAWQGGRVKIKTMPPFREVLACGSRPEGGHHFRVKFSILSQYVLFRGKSGSNSPEGGPWPVEDISQRFWQILRHLSFDEERWDSRGLPTPASRLSPVIQGVPSMSLRVPFFDATVF